MIAFSSLVCYETEIAPLQLLSGIPYLSSCWYVLYTRFYLDEPALPATTCLAIKPRLAE